MEQPNNSDYRSVTSKDWMRTGAYIILAIAAVTTGGIVLIPRWHPFGMIVWLFVIVGGSLVLLVRWHARATAYRCPECLHEFEISAWKDFISPHIIDKKYLRCPSCGKRRWAIVMMKKFQS